MAAQRIVVFLVGGQFAQAHAGEKSALLDRGVRLLGAVRHETWEVMRIVQLAAAPPVGDAVSRYSLSVVQRTNLEYALYGSDMSALESGCEACMSMPRLRAHSSATSVQSLAVH